MDAVQGEERKAIPNLDDASRGFESPLVLIGCDVYSSLGQGSWSVLSDLAPLVSSDWL